MVAVAVLMVLLVGAVAWVKLNVVFIYVIIMVLVVMVVVQKKIIINTNQYCNVLLAGCICLLSSLLL